MKKLTTLFIALILLVGCTLYTTPEPPTSTLEPSPTATSTPLPTVTPFPTGTPESTLQATPTQLIVGQTCTEAGGGYIYNGEAEFQYIMRTRRYPSLNSEIVGVLGESVTPIYCLVITEPDTNNVSDRWVCVSTLENPEDFGTDEDPHCQQWVALEAYNAEENTYEIYGTANWEFWQQPGK